MKFKIFAIAMVTTAGVILNTSAEARVGWQGRALVTAVTQACINDGQLVGDQTQNVSYFPAGLSDNGNDSYLSFYGQRALYSVKVVGSFASAKPYTAVKINSYGKSDTNGAGQIVQFVSTPVAEDTKFINITVRITNHLEVVGCTKTFEIALVRRLG
jgi:hypothetical protein